MRIPRIVATSWMGIAAGAAALVLTSAWAYYVIFARFSWYDDEGYVMMTVRQFIEGRALYDEVYSQYGPFYYLVRWAVLTVVQGPVSHDVTRLFTLITWIAGAALVAVFLLRMTQSGVVALVGYFVTLQRLRPLANEPGHPQELCLLLLAALIVLAAWWNSPRQASALMIACGVIVGGLTLTKINVGTYAFLGLATTIATFASHGRTVYLVLSSIAGAALPWAVMRTHAEWSSEYAAVVSLSSLAVAVVCRALLTVRPFGSAAVLRFIAAATATGVGACLMVLVRGTSVTGLVTGVLLQPLGFAEIFFNEVRFPVLSVLVAAASLLLAMVYRSPRLSESGATAALSWAFWWLKAAAGLFGIALALVVPDVLLAVGPALMWFVLIRPLGEPWPYEDLMPRVVLVSLAVFQTLQAYPVAGSQIAWATFLPVPALLLCMVDAVAELAATRPGRLLRARFPDRRWVEAAMLGAILVLFAARLDVVGTRDRYRSLTPLSLPGSIRIRLPKEEAARYQWLVAASAQRCPTFITLPGLNSLYFWAGVEPPTGLNVTAWPALLNRQQQQHIVDAVRSRQNVCVFEYPAGIRTFGRDAIVLQQPLMRFVRDEFHVVDERGGYRVLVRGKTTPSQP